MNDVRNTTSLTKLCSLVTDGTHDSPKLLREGIPFIKSTYIKNGVIDFDNCDYISYEDHLKVISRSKPEQGDILFTNIGASLGTAAFIDTNIEFSIKNVALFKPDKKKVIPEYLYYLVISPEFQAELLSKMSGVAQPFLSLDVLRNHKVSYISDISTQSTIVEIIKKYDDLLKNNNKRIKLLEEMAQTIYNEWFVNFRFPGHEKVKMVDSELGKIPEGWEISTLRDNLELIKGVSYKGEFLTEDGIPMVNLKSVKRFGGFNREATKPYAGKYNERQTLKSGDVILANTDMTQNGDVIGSPAIVNGISADKIIFSHHIYKCLLLGNSIYTNYYLYNLLHDIRFKDYAKGVSIGTTVLGLNADNILNYKTVEPVRHQHLVEYFSNFVEPLYKESWCLESKNDTLALTRDLLIPKLISGEIDVSEIDI